MNISLKIIVTINLMTVLMKNQKKIMKNKIHQKIFFKMSKNLIKKINNKNHNNKVLNYMLFLLKILIYNHNNFLIQK